MKKWLVALPLLVVLSGCTHGNCRANKKDVPATAGEVPVATKTAASDRVKVFKADGSLQCGQGKAIPVAEMQKQLKDIKVHSAVNKNDGMMRIQVCGSPTGNANVYEIDRKNLEAAIKLGFKEWIAE